MAAQGGGGIMMRALGVSFALALSASATAAQTPPPVGGQVDEHGCLNPAGYVWCARERACVRPWEPAETPPPPSGGAASAPAPARDFKERCEVKP